MFFPRVIPTLLLNQNYLVKTKKFKNPRYLGDPINAVKIFNEKEVDELTFLDISASVNKSEPNYKLIENIASEAFMPLSYGGGINKIQHIKTLFSIGVEKIILNSIALENPYFITEASDIAGASSIVVSIDYKKNWKKKICVFSKNIKSASSLKLNSYAKEVQNRGAGEIILTSVDNDGCMTGYDYQTIRSVCEQLEIPVIACGGASSLEDMKKVVDCGAAAAAAGNLFLFHGDLKGFLISYPDRELIENTFLLKSNS